jgi:uncharacterized membrane protein
MSKELYRLSQYASLAAYLALAAHTLFIQEIDLSKTILMILVLGNGVYVLRELKNYCEGKDAWLYHAYLNPREEDAMKSFVVAIAGLGIVATCLIPIVMQRME